MHRQSRCGIALPRGRVALRAPEGRFGRSFTCNIILVNRFNSIYHNMLTKQPTPVGCLVDFPALLLDLRPAHPGPDILEARLLPVREDADPIDPGREPDHREHSESADSNGA